MSSYRLIKEEYPDRIRYSCEEYDVVREVWDYITGTVTSNEAEAYGNYTKVIANGTLPKVTVLCKTDV